MMQPTRSLAPALLGLSAVVFLAGCGDLSDFPTASTPTAGCATACAAAATPPLLATPVAVPTLDPALVAWRSMVHDRLSGLMKDLDAIGGCGGPNGDDRSDCHRRITALITDARAMRGAVTAPPVPPEATTDAGKVTDALDQLIQGCAHDDAALASSQMFVWLPGSATRDAFQTLLAVDDELRTA
jgi:hypothetical protein